MKTLTDKDSAVDHIPEERLLAYLDDELEGSLRAAVAEHLLGCRRCAGRLDGLRSASRLLSRALAHQDVAPPEAGLRIRRESRGSRGARRTARVAWIRAAALVLVVGGASAAAIPGSPVRGWIEQSVDRIFAGSESADEQALPAQSDAGVSGVAAKPLYGRIVVDVLGAAPGTTLRVRAVDGPEAAAWSAAGRYRTGPGHIEVLAGGGGDVRVDLPRDATFAEVRVEGEPVSRLTDSQLIPLAQVERDGSDLLFRIGR